MVPDAHRDPTFERYRRSELRQLKGCPVCAHAKRVMDKWVCRHGAKFDLSDVYACGFREREARK